MENAWRLEQNTLISELIEGMELAKQLRVNLGSAETSELLVQRILSSYEKALLILKWSGSMGQAQAVGATGGVLPESPISINGSPRSEDFDGALKDNQESSKKRKTLPRWTDKVKVNFESGLEGPFEDGYSWRKYGQKDILGAKYPRSYYRCTYRNTQNCWATKQVQRSDEDPSIFEVTYRGTHTCFNGSQSVPQPASPEKHEQKLNHHSNNHQNCSGINNEYLDNKEVASPFSFPTTSFGYMKSNDHCFSSLMLEENNFLGGFSSSFIPPAAAESNFYYISQNQMNFGDVHNLQQSESDLPELQSANNSAANSPILNLDFSLDPAELDSNFPFDTPEFSF